MRQKWDEQHFADGSTYGEKTIERVLASTDEVYTPGEDSSPSDDAPADGTPAETADEPATSHTSPVNGSESGASHQQHERNDAKAGTATPAEAELNQLVQDLREQVERLEDENQRLREELAARKPTDTGTPDDPDGGTGRLRGLLPF